MKPSRKIIILILAFFFLSGVFLFVALTQERGQIIQTPTQTPTQEIVKPVFPEYSKGYLPVSLPGKLELQTPENLPLITVNLEEINKERAKTIAKNLNFTTNEIEINDFLDGTKYAWANTRNYFWVTPKKSHLKYGMNKFQDNNNTTQLSDQYFENKALDFATNMFGFDEEILEISSIIYLKQSPVSEGGFIETTRDQVQLFHVNLTYKNIGYPILTNIPLFQIFFVEILPNGEIFRAEAYVFKNINTSEKKYRVKTLTEIKNSLNEARLLSLENDYINLNDVKQGDIRNIDIRRIDIGYYFNNEIVSLTLQPVFLLEGSVVVKNSTADVAKLYIHALQE
jgi:hypothetical protein